jgi:tetratricopeptide (TPR) repeat protein
MKKILKTTILSLSIFTTFASHSANTDLELTIAQDMLNKNQAKDGYDFLLAGFDESSVNPLEYRLLGILAKANGKLFTAKDYFNLAIKHSKNSALTGEMKLELAQVEYQLGNGDIAKSYLSQVKSSNPPKKVGDNIDNFLEVIATRGTPSKYRFNASVGLIHDSNVNAGPDVDSVLMFGLPFTLSTDAKATSDNAKVLKFGASHNTAIADDKSVQSSLSLSKTDYNKLDNLDSLSLSASSGVSYKISDKTVVSVPFVADWVKIGHDNSYYSYSYGIAPQLRHQIDKQLSANGNMAISRKKYQATGKGDNENLSLGGGVSYQIDNKSYTSGGISLAKSNADSDSGSSKSHGVNLRYGYNFAGGFQSSVSLGYNSSKYGGLEPAYTEIRDDKTTTIGLSGNYKIKAIDGDLILSISHTKNDSNLAMYEYSRNQISVSLGKSF